MISLPNGCYCSPIKVFPKTWQNAKPALKKDWYVYYRFYDPAFKNNEKFHKGKLVVIKGMNHFETVLERQLQTQVIIDKETNRLKIEAYNPITIKESPVLFDLTEIDSQTGFNRALIQTEQRLSGCPSTKRDLKSILKSVTTASEALRYSEIPISAVSRKHLKQILAFIDNTLGESAHRYNKIRSYLMIIYKELIEMEVVEINPLRDLAKKKTVHRLKKLHSTLSRQTIDKYLKSNQYRFWLFTHIFFHSGARLTEMMLVKKKDVSIKEQTFMITIKKGSYFKEVLKPMKNISVQYWEEAISNAQENDYIFSKGLMPGITPIQSYQITKRWNRHIKKKLNIQEDFYSLKHLNLDETSSINGIDDAAAMASHSSSNVTLKYYAVNEITRQNERLKAMNNSFA